MERAPSSAAINQTYLDLCVKIMVWKYLEVALTRYMQLNESRGCCDIGYPPEIHLDL